MSYKTREEIATELGISPRTLKRKMDKYEIKPPAREALDLKWQKKIYDATFWPKGVNRSDYSDGDIDEGGES